MPREASENLQIDASVCVLGSRCLHHSSASDSRNRVSVHVSGLSSSLSPSSANWMDLEKENSTVRTWPVSQSCRRLLSIHCSQWKPILKIKKLQTIRYLLGINKDRGRVLVHQLVAAVGVNMRHFCAVDVQGHLVLINPRFFWVPGRTLTQGLSEKQGGAGGVVSQWSQRDESVPPNKTSASHTFHSFAGSGSRRRIGGTEGIQAGRWPRQVSPSTTEQLCLFAQTRTEVGRHNVQSFPDCNFLQTLHFSLDVTMPLQCKTTHTFFSPCTCRLFSSSTIK